MRREKRGAARGSPRSFVGKSALLRMTSLFLALRAVVAAAAGDHYSLDRGLADEAWLRFAAVDAVFELKESLFAVCVYVVGNGGTTQRDRFYQDLLNGGMKFRKRFAIDCCGSAAGADACAEQRFVGVNVSHAAKEFLVQQRAFNRRLAPAEESYELIEVDLQRFDARGVKCGFRRDAEASETARIDEAQFPT